MYRVELQDGEVLDDAVEGHELEDAEGGGEGGPAFSVEEERGGA